MAKPRHQIPGQIVLPLKMYEDLRETANFAYDSAGVAQGKILDEEFHALDEHVARQTFPKYARLANVGRVRVLEYIGEGVFRVLDKSDQKRRVHRDQLVFLKR
jgi:hypothetical protein